MTFTNISNDNEFDEYSFYSLLFALIRVTGL